MCGSHLKPITLVEQLETLGSFREHWILLFSANIPSCLELDVIIALYYTVTLPEDLLDLFIQ